MLTWEHQSFGRRWLVRMVRLWERCRISAASSCASVCSCVCAYESLETNCKTTEKLCWFQDSRQSMRRMCVFVQLCLASTILMGPLWLLTELWPLFISGDSWIVVVQTLWHPLADDVHQSLECLLHVNVVFSTCFKVLKTCRERRQRRAVVRWTTPMWCLWR